jgi:hypothetical protein
VEEGNGVGRGLFNLTTTPAPFGQGRGMNGSSLMITKGTPISQIPQIKKDLLRFPAKEQQWRFLKSIKELGAFFQPLPLKKVHGCQHPPPFSFSPFQKKE